MQLSKLAQAVALISTFMLLPGMAQATASNDSFCQSESCQSDFKKLERMARYGSGEAATVVAVAYATGDGIERDVKKARRHIKQAVRWREPMGLHQMSTWLRQGFVFEQDIRRANELLDQAAKLEFAPALTDKAKLLLGENTAATDTQAIALLEKANEQHYSPARYLLAELFASGVAVEADLGRAGALYKNLALKGYADSRQRLDEIIKVMELMTAQPDPELVALVKPVLANFKQIDDIEVIAVRGQQFNPTSELSSMVNQLDNVGLFQRGAGSGSRIPGNICGRGAAMCSTGYDRRTGNAGAASSVGELLGGM